MTARGRSAALVLAAMLIVGAVYGRSIDFDLSWDGYWMLRPWLGHEVRAALHGSWDPTGNEEPFYRPAAALFQAGVSYLAGLNGRLLHLLSLALFAAAAWLLGLLVLGEGAPLVLALGAVALYLLHPLMPIAAAVFLAVQTHLVASLLVLGTLRLWQRRRGRRGAAWWPMALLAATGWFVKEDVAMLVPAVVVLQVVWTRMGWIDDPPPLRPIVAGAAALAIALAALRLWIFPEFGGHHLQTAWLDVVRVFLNNPYRSFIWLRGEPLASVGLGCAIAAGVTSIILAGPSVVKRVAVLGAVVMLLFNVPGAFVAGPSRVHLIVIGGVLLMSAGLAMLAGAARGRASRTALTIGVTAMLVTLVAATRRAVDTWSPCSAPALSLDRDVIHAGIVPVEIKRWLMEKPAKCASGTLAPLSRSVGHVTWGAGPADGAGGWRRLSDEAVILLDRRASGVRLTFRALAPASARVTLRTDGRSVETVDATAGRDAEVLLPLTANGWVWLRDMHRVDVRCESAGGGSCPVQIGPIELR